MPVGHCAECRSAFCDKHGEWADDRWLCRRCKKTQAAQTAQPTPTGG